MMTGRDWIRRLQRRIDRLGVDLEFGSRYARAQDAEAIMVHSIDHPRILICFRDQDPTVSAVLEELAHAAQVRRGHFSHLDAEEQIIRREIEANECLDRLGERLQLSEDERAGTRQRLAQERARLARRARWYR
ncbi:MAG TPA: hypothetical protein VH877_33260 [Polyangia bacterium]|jgi:hypothetical protein|nr:hypothetical protein [Polyangia bacterium]